jgi:hypothetical protein
MRLTIYCARCRSRLRAAPPEPVVGCRGCGADLPLRWDESILKERRVESCAVCGRREFYVEADFPARIGCLVVVGCIVAFLVTENLWILVGAGIVNAVLWWTLPRRTICYACLTEYRGAARNPAHVEYDLAKAARFADRPGPRR